MTKKKYHLEWRVPKKKKQNKTSLLFLMSSSAYGLGFEIEGGKDGWNTLRGAAILIRET